MSFIRSTGMGSLEMYNLGKYVKNKSSIKGAIGYDQ